MPSAHELLKVETMRAVLEEMGLTHIKLPSEYNTFAACARGLNHSIFLSLRSVLYVLFWSHKT